MFYKMNVFNILPEGSTPPQGYTRIRLVWAFTNIFDGRKCTRGAGGWSHHR